MPAVSYHIKQDSGPRSPLLLAVLLPPDFSSPIYWLYLVALPGPLHLFLLVWNWGTMLPGVGALLL